MKEAKKAEADVALELLKLQHTFQDCLRRSDVKAFAHVAWGRSDRCNMMMPHQYN